MRQLFGSEGSSSMMDDIDERDAMDFIFGQSKLLIGEGGALKIPKPEPIKIEDSDRRRMFRARVLEGELPLVRVPSPFSDPVTIEDSSSGSEGLDDGGKANEEGLVGVVADEILGRIVSNILTEVIGSMATEVACDVGFEEDAIDVWELHRR